MQQSEPLSRMFSLYRQTADETKREVNFRRWRQGAIESILAKMDGQELPIASIIQPVFERLALKRNLGDTDGFVPAVALNGPHRNEVPIVRQYLQAFCDYLKDTDSHIRLGVVERPNSDGELCLGLAVSSPTFWK